MPKNVVPVLQILLKMVHLSLGCPWAITLTKKVYYIVFNAIFYLYFIPNILLLLYESKTCEHYVG